VKAPPAANEKRTPEANPEMLVALADEIESLSVSTILTEDDIRRKSLVESWVARTFAPHRAHIKPQARCNADEKVDDMNWFAVDPNNHYRFESDDPHFALLLPSCEMATAFVGNQFAVRASPPGLLRPTNLPTFERTRGLTAM